MQNYEQEMADFGAAMAKMGSRMRVAVLEENCCGFDIGRALMHAHASIALRRHGAWSEQHPGWSSHSNGSSLLSHPQDHLDETSSDSIRLHGPGGTVSQSLLPLGPTAFHVLQGTLSAFRPQPTHWRPGKAEISVGPTRKVRGKSFAANAPAPHFALTGP